MRLFPPCKINFGLRVLRRRPDGYHDLESIFLPVPFLHDDLELTRLADSDGETTLLLSGIDLDGDAADNLCLRAYRLLKADFPDLPPVQIRLHKRIPFGAGLGGGSSDAAFTLKGLNELFGLGLDDAGLECYAARLGADCPFFIRCVPALVEGIGDRLTPLGYNPIEGRHLLLAKPLEAVSTREAYAGLDAKMEGMERIEGMGKMESITSIQSLANDFEASVFPRHPAIAQLKADLYALGAGYASMSGSGSVVYGFFDDAAALHAAAQRLRQTHPDCQLFFEE